MLLRRRMPKVTCPRFARAPDEHANTLSRQRLRVKLTGFVQQPGVSCIEAVNKES